MRETIAEIESAVAATVQLTYRHLHTSKTDKKIEPS
jgi:hypothetical protein